MEALQRDATNLGNSLTPGARHARILLLLIACTGNWPMHILCPHCQSPIELVSLRTTGEILCASCGSSFRLEGESTTGYSGDSKGRKLGKFELLDTVGQGAFGTVYRARDPELDRT